MIDVAILSVIRRWHLRVGSSIREIARRTGLSSNTIRKYLANGVVEPKYQPRKSPGQLDEFACKLTHRRYNGIPLAEICCTINFTDDLCTTENWRDPLGIA